jgi:hypothetical protein
MRVGRNSVSPSPRRARSPVVRNAFDESANECSRSSMRETAEGVSRVFDDNPRLRIGDVVHGVQISSPRFLRRPGKARRPSGVARIGIELNQRPGVFIRAARLGTMWGRIIHTSQSDCTFHAANLPHGRKCDANARDQRVPVARSVKRRNTACSLEQSPSLTRRASASSPVAISRPRAKARRR